MMQTVHSPGLEKIQIPSPHLRVLIEVVKEFGFDLTHDMLKTGVDPDKLKGDHISLAVADRFLRQAVALVQEPALGLLLGRRLRTHTHDMLCFGMMNASGFREAIDLLVHYFPNRTQLMSLRLSDSADQVRLVFQQAVHLGFAEQIITEVVMLAVHNALRFVMPDARLVSRVDFVAPKPGYEAEAVATFDCPVHYGQASNALWLVHDAWQVPFLSPDCEALRLAKMVCHTELGKRSKADGILSMVRQCLIAGTDQLPSLEACAASLNISPRTLHRRLEVEGTSFRLLLDETRHRLALQHMSNPAMSLQQIAYSLGYTDQANFRRAFKRWEGVAPQVRRDEASFE